MAPASSSRNPNPTSWDEYEGRPSRSGSQSSSVLAGEQALADDDEDEDAHAGDALLSHQERRRSSVTHRLTSMADLGGVNSIRSFARSWQRAAAFPEVIPRRPSFVYADDAQHFFTNPDDEAATSPGEGIHYGRSLVDAAPRPHTSLLREHLDASPPSDVAGGPSSAAAGADFRERESKALDPELASVSAAPMGSSFSSIFAVPPHLAAPSIVGSYGGSPYGTISGGSLRHRVSIVSQASERDADDDESDEDDDDAALGEHQPILVKEVKQGSKVVLAVEGQSTLPQSVFNSINALIGVGLLSLPLAFKMSGWILGLLILSVTAAVTAYTAKLLARCMELDPSLITYSDLAYVSFGARARLVVSALFSLELIAACVALVILFADSLDLLLPGWASVNFWKCVCAVLVLVLNALPLRWLSYTSVIGIFSTFCIVCIVIMDGIVKKNAPGSLWEPATTYLLPSNWLSLPLAYGLLASPWGAHSVFPSIYRDMRHPHKWGSAVKVTFSFSYVLDTCLAIIGILMFGDGIRDAITSNILRTPGYPQSLTILMCVFIAIIPLTKIPLNARPIITTADVLCGVHRVGHGHGHGHHHHAVGDNTAANRRAAWTESVVRACVRLGVVLVLLVISILFPAFDSVCAFLGAALCTLISIILPISFYLKLYWKDVAWRERAVLFALLGLFAVLGSVGTVWTFLPKELVGA